MKGERATRAAWLYDLVYYGNLLVKISLVVWGVDHEPHRLQFKSAGCFPAPFYPFSVIYLLFVLKCPKILEQMAWCPYSLWWWMRVYGDTSIYGSLLFSCSSVSKKSGGELPKSQSHSQLGIQQTATTNHLQGTSQRFYCVRLNCLKHEIRKYNFSSAWISFIKS